MKATEYKLLIGTLLTVLTTASIADNTLETTEHAALDTAENASSKKPQHLTREQIAEMVNNPLSYLWMIAVQNDYIEMDGDIDGADKIHANITAIMPVMPLQLTDNYKLIVRPWLPYISLDIPKNAGDLNWEYDSIEGREIPTGIKSTSWHSGIGDAGIWTAIASNEAAKPPFVWGAGITAQFDTASEDEYGSGKYSAGPMGLAFYIGKKWIFGGIFQHWWSYAGDDDRPFVNKTNLQYVIQYRITSETNIGCTPNYTYNWRTKKYDLPVGLGANTLIKIGKLPIKVLGEVYYHLNNSDPLHTDWQARILFMPIIPSPDWSHKPLLNF